MRWASLLLLAALPVSAADREFRDIVDAISDHYHTRPMRIPFFGLVNAFTFVARPAGTKHIELAVFEDLNGRPDPLDIRKLVGGRWKPFVQTYSKRKGETTLIYVRTEGGGDVRMLITTLERNEATVMELKLNAEAMRKWLDDPKHGRAEWH